MEENSQFSEQLQAALTQKQEWYNTKELPSILDQYRLLHTCVKNLYEFLTKKSLIVPDPYRLDRKISDITSPETSPFTDNEIPQKVGQRFSEYETMLDFICTYFRFSTETLTLSTIKKLEEFNGNIKWGEFTPNSLHPNTRGLAVLLTNAKNNAEAISISMIHDSVEKASRAVSAINRSLSPLAKFQRELYKGTLRRDIFEHPSFNKEKAFSSPENEFNEIKRLYPDVLGKKPFYKELVMEIINEDQGKEKDKLRAELLQSLEVQQTAKKTTKKKEDPKELLFAALNTLGALAPIYVQIISKTNENFQLMNIEAKGFLGQLKKALMKIFNIKPKEQEIMVSATDPVTKAKIQKRIKVYEFLDDLQRKNRIYNAILNKGQEYQRITESNTDSILSFISKQISENQNLFNTLSSLDEYFKSKVAPADKAKVRGIKIELESMRLTIINCNKKRSEYIAVTEEIAQMKKLGIEDNE